MTASRTVLIESLMAMVGNSLLRWREYRAELVSMSDQELKTELERVKREQYHAAPFPGAEVWFMSFWIGAIGICAWMIFNSI